MRQYIINLTGHLINKNYYDNQEFFPMETREKFIKGVMMALSAGDVAVMSPAKLGEIMCSFEVGDVMTNTSEIWNNVGFAGDCGDMLRDLVSLCLAYAISERLYGDGIEVPTWRGDPDRILRRRQRMTGHGTR